MTLFTTPHWSDPGPTKAADDPHLPADWPPHAQVVKVAEVANLLHAVDTPLSAGYVLGMVRGRLNVLRELGLLSNSECAGIGESVKDLFDERWPGVFAEVMGRG